LKAAGIECVSYLAQRYKGIMREFMDAGFKAVIICVNERFLDQSFCGKNIDKDFCGENEEFHVFVCDVPIFHHPINFEKGKIVYREYLALKIVNPTAQSSGRENQNYGFYFCDLLLNK
jgi:diphthamide synthase (EF-2-diphthine--ammonia ligase)